MKKSSLALIVPCYNEADAIPYFEAELRLFRQEFARNFPGEELGVVIVENASSDASGALLRELAARAPGVRVEFCGVRGYGAALKHGFAAAEADYLSFLDLDNTYPLSSLIVLLRKAREEKLDIVYGARIHKDSRIGPLREIGNRLYVGLLRWLLKAGLSDVCSGMRVFRSERRAEVLALKSDSLSFSIELSAHAVLAGWRIGEHPIAYRERVGESKLSLVKDGFGFLFVVLLKYARRVRK